MSLNTSAEQPSLSSVNQTIHKQRDQIKSLESTVALLEKMVAEEQEAKYTAWKKLADVKQLNKLV
tara:strand:+ start:200 stop:394 length:195 start_codon:yes stop_codon:yes gene_type:complete